jgi:hypothetical protein
MESVEKKGPGRHHSATHRVQNQSFSLDRLLFRALLLTAIFLPLSVIAPAAAHPQTAGDVYIPVVQKPASQPRPLGAVSLVSGPTACQFGECYEVEVTCQQATGKLQATLRVNSSTAPAPLGTIVFASGWTGDYYWGFSGTNFPAEIPKALAPLAIDDAVTNNGQILANLRQDGYRTVEIKWKSSWWDSTGPATMEGFAKLACRPATVINWIYQNLHTEGVQAPYCAVGHSNGASQVGFSLAQYGQSDLIQAALFESGPNWSRVDQGCLHDDPAYSALFLPLQGRQTSDLSFGFPADGTGPCAVQDTSARPDFEDASLALGDWLYNFRRTSLAFIMGGMDTTYTAQEGLVFHNKVIEEGSPNVTLETVAGAPHFVTDITAGAVQLEQTLRAVCQ